MTLTERAKWHTYKDHMSKHCIGLLGGCKGCEARKTLNDLIDNGMVGEKLPIPAVDEMLSGPNVLRAPDPKQADGGGK